MIRLTESSVNFLNEMAQEVDSAQKSEGGTVERLETLWKDVGAEQLDEFNSAVRMPENYADFGVIYEGNRQPIAKFRYAHEPREISQTRKEAMVAIESERRGHQDLFATVYGWDVPEFNWIVMEEVKPEDLPWKENVELVERYKEKGWQVGDNEYGRTEDGNLVFYGYGLFDRDDWIISQEAVFNDE